MSENAAKLNPSNTADAGEPKEETPAQKEARLHQERFEVVNEIIGRETFIEPLDGDRVAKAYSVYHRNPEKIIKFLMDSFKEHCRKCIRETILQKHKDELNLLTLEAAEQLRLKLIDMYYKKIESDPVLEHLLVMLVFKKSYWNWIRFGLKEIFNEQRTQPGNVINTYFNTRFHKLKDKHGFRMVGDLVQFDTIQIVNSFKNEVLKKGVRLFK